MSLLNKKNFITSFPTIQEKRNRFPFEKEINFNLKMGEITPITAIRVNPGQTYKLDISTVLKVAPMQVPPMDDAYLKLYAFYQADRNTWDNYPYWMGEKKSPENPDKEPTYVVPKVTAPTGGFKFNGFFDNIGCVPGIANYKIDAFLNRGFIQTYNNYFRNQALEDPIPVSTGDEDDSMEIELLDGTKINRDDLLKICRPRDLFAQCLPNRSGEESVEIPLGTEAPVTFLSKANTWAMQIPIKNGNTEEVMHAGLYSPSPAGTSRASVEITASPGWPTDEELNLKADLSKAIGAPLDVLYTTIAANTYNYLKSRGGGRYFEILSNIYGVSNPDQVLRLPEYLGSLSQYIDFDTITNVTESGEGGLGLGERAANGYCENYGNIIEKSFGEFGWIIIYGTVTYCPKYQQGVSRQMKTEDPLDLFCPIFNYQGDEPIYMDEIYQQSDSVVDEDGNKRNDIVWGYGKRNSRILYPINEIHGEQRSSYAQSLDVNHFAEFYASEPKLNKDWDKIDDAGFRRSLQIQDETQFIGNCLITGIQDIQIPIDPIPSPIPQQILEANRR